MTRATPAMFGLLLVPPGLAASCITVIFPFLANQAKLSVAITASLVAIGLLAWTLKFAWAPVVDLSFTLKGWCSIATGCICVLMVLLAMIPINQANKLEIGIVFFALGAAACLQSSAAAGLLAHTIEASSKGIAAGYYQVGSMAAGALGGGGGIWLTSRPGGRLAISAVFVLASLATLVVLLFLDEPKSREVSESARIGVNRMWKDLIGVVRLPRGTIVVLVVLTPIGIGATSHFWPSIAPEWDITPNSLAIITGVGGPIASLVGCLLAGWACDKFDAISAFLLSGLCLVVVGIALALMPHVPSSFASISIVYMAAVGASNGAYSAMIFGVIGRGAAAFKYAAIGSLGNLPGSYMTAINGRVHDFAGTSWMLCAESSICLVFIVVFGIWNASLSKTITQET